MRLLLSILLCLSFANPLFAQPQSQNFVDDTGGGDTAWQTVLTDVWAEARALVEFALNQPLNHVSWHFGFGLENPDRETVRLVFRNLREFSEHPPDDLRLHKALHYVTMRDQTIIPFDGFPEAFRNAYHAAVARRGRRAGIWIRDLYPADFRNPAVDAETTLVEDWLDRRAYGFLDTGNLVMRLSWGRYAALLNVNNYLLFALSAFINRETNWPGDELNPFPLPEHPDAWTPIATDPDEFDVIVSPALVPEMHAFAEISATYGLNSGISSGTFPFKRSKARRELQKGQDCLEYGLRVGNGLRMGAAVDSDIAFGMQQQIKVAY
ncbi:uncharacterized protein AB675_11021 [Cyphellophora attinorum]|uniref:Uncharacterized protein n=1 Tax=Cyphellophora attinorum TaxID=1664694 RepID=A0A0N1NVD5_9EURO|nr:uncharacterized protein AB675_11021 [Phialophora attinorum]KPI34515.1 hypothetical protein AB675_11021 [Phialophora attinorum]